MNKEVFLTLLYFTGLLAVAALMVYLLSPFLSALAWAGVIGLAAQPMHRRFLKWFGGRKNVAALVTTASVVVIIVLPAVVLAILFAGQAMTVVASLQDYVAAGHVPGRQEVLANPKVQQLLKELQPYTMGMDLKPLALGFMKSASNFGVNLSKVLFKGAVAGLFKFFVMVAVLFFALRDGKSISDAFWEAIPLKECDKLVIVGAVKRVIDAVLYGIVLTCFVQGILGGVGFAMVGLPSPVFFGAIMVVCSFIPVVGAALVWVPAALYLLATGEVGKAAILALWGAAVVSTIDNFIRPLFISGKSKVPLLVVMLGVLGGLATMGFLGIILGPLLFTVSLEVFRVYRTDIFRPLRDLQPADRAPCPEGTPPAQ